MQLSRAMPRYEFVLFVAPFPLYRTVSTDSFHCEGMEAVARHLLNNAVQKINSSGSESFRCSYVIQSLPAAFLLADLFTASETSSGENALFTESPLYE